LALGGDVMRLHVPSAIYDQWTSDQIPPLVRTILTLPTPVHFYDAYLGPVAETLRHRQLAGDFQTTQLFINLAIAFGMALFWLALASVMATWRMAIRDPVLVAGLIAIVLNGPIVLFSRLGNYTHLWLSVVSLAFYVAVWSAPSTLGQVAARVDNRLVRNFNIGKP
jgi:hypothetical protein